MDEQHTASPGIGINQAMPTTTTTTSEAPPA